MKEELYIYTPEGSREQLDLPSPSGVTLKWVNNLFSDISKLTCSHSYTFKLPQTQRNIRLLDMANDIRHKSKMIRKRVDADFYINGVCLCPNANLYVSEVGDTTFSCVLTWRVLKAFETLKSSSMKLSDLPSLGRFTWKEDDEERQHGFPSGKWSNMADLLYPDYDAGVPHETGAPPKPVVPVFRLIQMINDQFGVKFNIGRQIDSGMGLLPAVDFNNKKFYGRCIYDDYVTYGVVPVTGAKPFLSDKYVAKDIDFINLPYALQDGSFQQEGSYRRFTKQDDDTKFFRKYEHWRDINVSKRHYYGGIANIADYQESSYHLTPIRVQWNEYIGTERLQNLTREQSVSEVKVEKLNMWWSESNAQTGYYSGRYDGYDVYYAKRTVENYLVFSENYQHMGGPLTLKLEANCEIRGTATIIVKKAAVKAGRTEAPDYWWMYLLEATKDENNEVTLDKLSDNGEDWIGFRSIRREETDDAYVYYFDFGVEYEARRINVDAIEEDSLGYIFWSGYEYTPPEDQTTSLQDIYESDNREFTGLVAGYSELPVNFPDIDKTDTFDADDVRFGSLHIASITPSLDTVTKLPVEMNVMENLPEISCFDFIKDIFYMNGALPRVDKDGKTIVAMYYNQLRDRMLSGECVDWSDKLISGKDQASLSKYENTNFAQKNYFEMGYSRREKTEEDKRDELELYGEGYGTVGIADSLLADEKSVYKSKFFPGLRQDIAYPLVITGRTIKTWDGEKHVVTTTNPLYGYLNIRTLDEEYEDTENWMKRPLLRKNGKDFKHIRMNAFEPFDDIDNLFGYLGAILENYTCVKEKMLLNEFDLRDFDESVPVYLHKYNAFFAVSSIQRDKAGLSTVELILLPYVTPTYKDKEDTEVQTESFSYEILSAFLSFTLNLTRTYTSNVCPLAYDIFVNNQNEGWRTTYNTLQEGLKEHGYYLSKWVSPYNDRWNEQPYTLEFTVYEKVRYKVTKVVGFDTEYTEELVAGLKVYYDDVLLEPGKYTKTFTKAEDGQYHVFKFAFDVYDKDGNLIYEYRKKLYYFVYTVDKSVINDEWGDVSEDTVVKVSGVDVSGPATIAGMSAHNYTMAFTPTYANIKAASVEVTSDTEDVTVSNVSLSGFTLTPSSLPTEAKTVTLTIKTTLENGSAFETTHQVSMVRPTLNIQGSDNFEVTNGTGYLEYSLVTTPTKSVTVKSVTSSNGIITVSNITSNPARFRLSVNDIASDVTSTITAVVDCDGIELTATKNVTITVKNAWSPDTLDFAEVMIVDINGMFYTKGEWKSAEVLNEDADGIAVSDGTHRFVIAKGTVSAKIGGYKETGMTPIEGGYVINSEGTLVSGQFTTTDEETAKTDFNGKANTAAIKAQISETTVGNATGTKNFPSGTESYLGSVGQWFIAFQRKGRIDELLKLIGGKALSNELTSTQYNDKQEWNVYYHNGNLLVVHNNKNGQYDCHPVSDVRNVSPVTIAKLEVSGDDSVSGTAGTTKEVAYTFATNPSGAAITEIDVKAGSDKVTISNVSASGFTASTTIDTADKVKITITARVNGLKRIVEKTLEISVESGGDDPSENPDFAKVDSEGAVIIDTDFNLYTESEWRASGKDASEAEGIAMSDGSHRYIMAKADTTPSSYKGVYWGGSGVVIPGMERGKGYDGYGNTQKIMAAITGSDGYYKDEPYSAAAYAAQADAFPSGKKGYLGSAGEWSIVTDNFDKVQKLLNIIGKKFTTATWPSTYWTSSIDDTDDAAWTFSTASKGAYSSWARRWASKMLVRVFRKFEK